MKATLMSFMLFIESHPVSCMPIAHAHVLTAPMHNALLICLTRKWCFREPTYLSQAIKLVLWSTALLRIGQKAKSIRSGVWWQNGGFTGRWELDVKWCWSRHSCVQPSPHSTGVSIHSNQRPLSLDSKELELCVLGGRTNLVWPGLFEGCCKLDDLICPTPKGFVTQGGKKTGLPHLAFRGEGGRFGFLGFSKQRPFYSMRFSADENDDSDEDHFDLMQNLEKCIFMSVSNYVSACNSHPMQLARKPWTILTLPGPFYNFHNLGFFGASLAFVA